MYIVHNQFKEFSFSFFFFLLSHRSNKIIKHTHLSSSTRNEGKYAAAFLDQIGYGIQITCEVKRVWARVILEWVPPFGSPSVAFVFFTQEMDEGIFRPLILLISVHR